MTYVFKVTETSWEHAFLPLSLKIKTKGILFSRIKRETISVK